MMFSSKILKEKINLPLKIDLKLGFEKLSNKVQVHNNIVNDIDQELEVYESNVEVSLDPNQIKISSIDIPVVHDQDRNTNFVVSESRCSEI